MKIREMIVNSCFCSQDVTGEWASDIHIEFMLNETYSFKIFNTDYKIDRLVLQSTYGDSFVLRYSDGNSEFGNIKPDKEHMCEIEQILFEEQKKDKSGRLRGLYLVEDDGKFDDEPSYGVGFEW